VTPAVAINVRHLGRRQYRPVEAAMQRFTSTRSPRAIDELWLVEHPPVFTLGINASREHLLVPQSVAAGGAPSDPPAGAKPPDALGGIEVVQTDRGGQVTYHGPGQLVLYPLLNLRRYGLGPRSLVTLLEQSVIALLADSSISAEARADAPGVYVESRKIASIGLRIRRGCSYHGLAVNVDVDLAPFRLINPCGFAGLQVTRLVDEGGPADMRQVGEALTAILLERLAAAGGVTIRTVTPDSDAADTGAGALLREEAHA
jgi:lipoyl(octanoyl) transferase